MLLTKVATAEKYQIKNWLDDDKKKKRQKFLNLKLNVICSC